MITEEQKQRNREAAARVKQSLSIVEIAERGGLALKRKGKSGELWACCPFHEERTPSFKINEQRQQFYCFGCGERGDALALARHLENFGTFAEALRTLGEGYSCEPSDWEERRRKAEREHAARQRRRIAEAREIWEEASAPEPGGAVRNYLAWRGVPSRIAALAIAAGDLREHRDRSGQHMLVARARLNETGQPSGGIHRTGIERDGRGKRAIWDGRTKMALGTIGGCSVRLAKLTPPYDDELAVAEGIESALSFWALHRIPCWSAINAEGIAKFRPPPSVRRLVIAADNDERGQAAARALYDSLKASVRVVIATPPEGDWNDALQLKNKGLAR